MPAGVAAAPEAVVELGRVVDGLLAAGFPHLRPSARSFLLASLFVLSLPLLSLFLLESPLRLPTLFWLDRTLHEIVCRVGMALQ